MGASVSLGQNFHSEVRIARDLSSFEVDMCHFRNLVSSRYALVARTSLPINY